MSFLECGHGVAASKSVSICDVPGICGVKTSKPLEICRMIENVREKQASHLIMTVYPDINAAHKRIGDLYFPKYKGVIL